MLVSDSCFRPILADSSASAPSVGLKRSLLDAYGGVDAPVDANGYPEGDFGAAKRQALAPSSNSAGEGPMMETPHVGVSDVDDVDSYLAAFFGTAASASADCEQDDRMRLEEEGSVCSSPASVTSACSPAPFAMCAAPSVVTSALQKVAAMPARKQRRKKPTSTEKPVERKEADFNALLLKAARSGNLSKVKTLVEVHGADVNYEAQSCTVLHYAAFYNHIHIVRFLVESGANVNKQNLSGLTPLHWALEKGDLELMKHLIGHGADPNVGDQEQLTPLHKAVRDKQYDALELLLSLGTCNLDAAASASNQLLTPLHTAATMGDQRAVAMLLRAGASVHTLTSRGATPLHKAAVRGHVDVLRMLVEEGGALVEVTDDVGRTPLHWAAFYHRVPAVTALRELGADPHQIDRFGSSSFTLATKKNYTDVIAALVS